MDAGVNLANMDVLKQRCSFGVRGRQKGNIKGWNKSENCREKSLRGVTEVCGL
jgi:hypothetical protein